MPVPWWRRFVYRSRFRPRRGVRRGVVTRRGRGERRGAIPVVVGRRDRTPDNGGGGATATPRRRGLLGRAADAIRRAVRRRVGAGAARRRRR